MSVICVDSGITSPLYSETLTDRPDCGLSTSCRFQIKNVPKWAEFCFDTTQWWALSVYFTSDTQFSCLPLHLFCFNSKWLQIFIHLSFSSHTMMDLIPASVHHLCIAINVNRFIKMQLGWVCGCESWGRSSTNTIAPTGCCPLCSPGCGWNHWADALKWAATPLVPKQTLKQILFMAPVHTCTSSSSIINT